MAEITPLQLIVPDAYVGPLLQAAVNQAGTTPKAAVWIPANYAGTDTYTNPGNAVAVFDMRSGGSISFGSGGAPAFSAITAGTNTSALVVGTGGSLTTSGSGTITATAAPFSGVSAGTNANALVVGTGGSLTTSGSGTITSTAVPFSGVSAGTNTNALVIGTGGSISTTGTGTIGAAGSTSNVQYNSSGVLAGNAGFTYDGVGTVLLGAGAGSTVLSVNGNGSTLNATINVNAAGTGRGILNVGAAGASGSSPAIFIGSLTATGVSLSVPVAGILTTSGTSATGINTPQYQAPEAAAPSGVASTDTQFGDSTTHTWSYNANNTGTNSFSGAWVNTNLSPVTVAANVTTDQNLMSVSVPAGTLNRAGRSLRFYATGVYSTAAASTAAITIKVKFGALTLVNIVTTALGGVTGSNNQFNLSGMLSVQTGGSSGVFEPHGVLVIDLGAGNLVPDTSFADTNSATVGTVDLTAAQTLQVTIAFSAASTSNSTTQRQMVLETVG